MKFWKLVSVFRDQQASLSIALLRAGSLGEVYTHWLANFDQHVLSQDRHVLDALVPESVVMAAMKQLDTTFLVVDDVLRLSEDVGAETLSAYEVSLRFGPSAVEEVLEKGPCSVDVLRS